MESSSASPLILGRYAIYDKIATGGMATVHIGRLLGAVGFTRTVAIKRMHAHFADDPEFVAMFLDEARLAARIRHPNVVPTLDVVAIDGALFLVLEYVQGESLSRLMRFARAQGERMPWAMAATTMAAMLHGLHAAHEAKGDHGEPLGIVHRDVSPQNLLIGVDGVARVLDFGVAKAITRMQTTRDGQIKGKLAYMAPEQLNGQVDRRSDVYAAAVVLWEILTGERLFTGDTEGQMLQRVLQGNVAAPSTHAPDTPPNVDALVLRGLATDPEKRFQTAREMALAIEDIVPLVAASKIGAWVERVASETLIKRSARIAAMEHSSPSDTTSATPKSVRDVTSPRNLPVSAAAAAAAAAAQKAAEQASAAAPRPPQLKVPTPTVPLHVGVTTTAALTAADIPEAATIATITGGATATDISGAPKVSSTGVLHDESVDVDLQSSVATNPTQLSSASAATAPSIQGAHTRGARIWLFALAGGLLATLLVVVGVAVLTRHRSGNERAGEPASASSSSLASAADSTPSPTTATTAATPTVPTTEAAASPTSNPPSSAALVTDPPASASASASAHAGPTPVRTTLTPTTKRPKPSCTPPYFIDGEGNRVFKKECL